MSTSRNRHRRLRPLVLAVWLGLLVAGVAQSPGWSLRAWQTEEGLLENTVTAVVQSPEGYLWVATQNGLARFDGARFLRVGLTANAQGVAHPLRTLLFTREQRLWAALDGGGLVGMALADNTNVIAVASGLSLARPLVLAEDAVGAIWAGYTDGSACRVAAGQVTRHAAASGLVGTGACWLASDTSGRIWFAKDGRIGIWRDERFVTLLTVPERNVLLVAAKAGGMWVCAEGRVFRYIEGAAPEPLATLPGLRAGVDVRALLEDRDGAVWVGTSTAGLFRCAAAGVTRVDTTHGEILGLAQDAEGNLWVGTGGGGLNRIRPRVLELHGTAAGLPFETVRSISEDRSERIWAVTLNGELASLEQGRWRKAAMGKPGENYEATCVTADSQGGVWVGTRQHGVIHLGGDPSSMDSLRAGTFSKAVRAMMMDRTGTLWVAVESPTPDHPNALLRWRNGEVRRFETPTGSRVIRAMAEDTAGQIWFGTPDGLLLRMAEETLVNETTRVLRQPKPIRSLLATPDGALWIGLAGTGLVRWKDGHASRFGVDQGLADGYVSSLLADGHGALWVACTRGLFRVPFTELQAVADGRTSRLHTVPQERIEGLRNMQANYGHWPGALRSRDGRLWFPMRTGLAVVRPDQATRSPVPPPVLVEGLLVDGSPLVAGPGVAFRLPGGHRKVEIEFTAFSFSGPENLSFRHRLTGWDEEWVPAGAGRRATYERLPPGKYEFRVTAATELGGWNPVGAALAFTVTPRFWQTGSFRLVGASAVTLGLVALVRYVSFRRLRAKLRRAQQAAAVHRERERIAKDIHDDIGASLTQISLLGDLVEHDLATPDKAIQHARTLSITARELMKSLDETVWAVNPSNDTLAHLLDYMGQFAVDFLRAAGVRCRVDFPLQPPVRALPAEVRHHLFLVVKEALHNVVKHARAKEVKVCAGVSGPSFLISVEDDGQGFSAGPNNTLADGLRNMRHRLAEIGGTCHVTSQPGGGTRVQFEWPWPKT